MNPLVNRDASFPSKGWQMGVPHSVLSQLVSVPASFCLCPMMTQIMMLVENLEGDDVALIAISTDKRIISRSEN
jgi:hypothetical protein